MRWVVALRIAPPISAKAARGLMSRKIAYCALLSAAFLSVVGQASAASSSASFPRYDHVFLVIEENHNFNQIIAGPSEREPHRSSEIRVPTDPCGSRWSIGPSRGAAAD
jgi:hypothetical protein